MAEFTLKTYRDVGGMAGFGLNASWLLGSGVMGNCESSMPRADEPQTP